MASTKLINGFAHNLAHQFTVSCEHIRYLMWINNISEFRANLLTGEIYQEKLSIDRNLNLISIVKSTFERNVVERYDFEFVKAELLLEFSGAESVTTVTIEAINGKTWSNQIKESNPLLVS